MPKKVPALAAHVQKVLMPMKKVPALAQLAQPENILPAQV